MSRGSLRDVTEADMDLLYDWVNDPISRASAFSNDMISYEDHCNWFQKMMCDQSILQYIYEIEQQPVGQARVEIKDGIGVIDYSIAPEYRLHGYGNDIINLLIKKMKTKYPRLEMLKAKVKPENIASQKIFQNNNFTTKYYEFEYEFSKECPEKW